GAEARGQDDMLQDAAAPHMLEPAIDDETMPSRGRMAPLPLGEQAARKSRRSGGGRGKVLLLLLLLAGLGWAVPALWPALSDLSASWRSPTQVEVASEPTVTTPTNRTKITERFEPSGQPATVAQQPQPAAVTQGGAAVAQRVVLYEEDPNDPQGKRFVGS